MAVSNPQLNEVTVYTIVVLPTATPVTTPDAAIEAIDGVKLLHTPPTAGSESVIILPATTESKPATEPASGVVFTVTLNVAVADPQLNVFDV